MKKLQLGRTGALKTGIGPTVPCMNVRRLSMLHCHFNSTLPVSPRSPSATVRGELPDEEKRWDDKFRNRFRYTADCE